MNQIVTPRENQVIDLISMGHSLKEVAELLQCSTGTAETHYKNAKRKMGLQKAGEVACAVMYKKYRLPLADLSEKVRKRIAAALLVLSIAGIFGQSDFLRVLRPPARTVRVTSNTGARRSGRRKDAFCFQLATA